MKSNLQAKPFGGCACDTRNPVGGPSGASHGADNITLNFNGHSVMSRHIALTTIATLAVALSGCASISKAGTATSPSPTIGPIATTTAVATSSTTTAPPAETAAPTTPVGIIAIGHSGLTGEGTLGSGTDARQNSWATGSAPEVDSVYLRLVATRPETLGHFANTAQGGAVAKALPDQARAALRIVAHPALVIISTIDNDIRCDGTDPQHVPEFGSYVANALSIITAASPASKILIVGQLGRPDPAYIEQLLAQVPSLIPTSPATGICDFVDQNGKIVQPHLETLTSIINAYEAEQARVCAAVPQCRTDGGVRAAYKDKIENFSTDYNHLNVKGQAAEAALIWPVVVSTLGL
jgi:hypothetical protein